MLAPRWHDISTIFLLFWIGEMCYTFIVNLTKIAIVLMYLRIFPSSITSHFRTACWIIIGICATSTIAVLLTIIFECNPVSDVGICFPIILCCC